MKTTISFLILSLLLFIGCDKDQYNYKKFLEGKEIVYAGLAENFSHRSGKLRVQLQWEKSIDPTVVSYIIYWGNNKDSAIVPASAVDIDGVYRHIISDLPEYVQSFKMVTQNDRGDQSVGQAITGVKVFGSIYNATLYNQRLSSRKFFGTDSVRLTFLPTDTTKIFSRIHYYRQDGVLDSVSFNNDVVTIKSYMPGTKPAIRSFYLPVANSIDTFRALKVDSLLAF